MRIDQGSRLSKHRRIDGVDETTFGHGSCGTSGQQVLQRGRAGVVETFIWVMCLGAIACRSHEWSRQPTVKVSGWIDGVGTFDLLLPEGYATVSAHSTGSPQQWSRGRGEPTVELDPTPSSTLPTCGRSRSDKISADELGAQKDISICRQSDGGIYVRRMTRGDDPLSCFVTFRANEEAEGEAVKAGVAICDSLHVNEHVRTLDPTVFSPSVGVHERIDFHSGATAFADLKIPAGYVIGRSPHEISIRHRVNSTLPSITIMEQRTVCDAGTLVSKTALEDGSEIVVCDLRTFGAMLVLRAIEVRDGEYVECSIAIYTTDDSMAYAQLHKPLPPDVVEQRQTDAFAICRSLKVTGYQKLGNPTR